MGVRELFFRPFSRFRSSNPGAELPGVSKTLYL